MGLAGVFQVALSALFQEVCVVCFDQAHQRAVRHDDVRSDPARLYQGQVVCTRIHDSSLSAGRVFISLVPMLRFVVVQMICNRPIQWAVVIEHRYLLVNASEGLNIHKV